MDSPDPAYVSTVPASIVLQRLENLNPSSQEFTKVLQSILFEKRYVAFAENLERHEAQTFINILDKVC